tara:strand:+ start:34 stop:837 length:804 start_codon:yes stop_codon:yes gene_type:complete
MCRLFIYSGNSILLKDILYNQKHSIFKQSFHKKFTPLLKELNIRDHELNIDGFGVIWYHNNINNPCLYTSLKTPWCDYNLKRLSNILESTLIFAHVRGIKPFSKNYLVHEYNCHPFIYKNYSFMHNGDISNFNSMKKDIINKLNDNIFQLIKGNTDSEYIFALLINELDNNNNKNYSIIIKNIIKYLTSFKNTMSLNLAFTDGETIVCTRFINSDLEEPPSIYYKKCKDNIIISSEPIDYKDDWVLIKKNSILIYNNKNLVINKLNL